jgi:hypothetical protein
MKFLLLAALIMHLRISMAEPTGVARVPVPIYIAARATTPITIDGRADEPAWRNASWTEAFVDIEGAGKPSPRFKTRAMMLWDDQNLYVFATMEEPHVWASLRERNSIVYHDNDFEIFIDPDGDRLNYYEFEMNALNTIMELHLDKPYIDGGNYTFVKSPNIRTAVSVEGTLNDASDIDRSWSIEVAIPFSDLSKHAAGVKQPPKVGDEWRINFSRVEWTHRIVNGKYEAIPKSERNEDNWVWSPTGVIDMHRPERWGRLRFGK